MDTKPIWQSKTFWLAGLQATLAAMQASDLSFLSDKQASLAFLALSIGQVWVRMLTSQGVTLK